MTLPQYNPDNDINKFKKSCPTCGNPFRVFNEQRIYCSPNCASHYYLKTRNLTHKEWANLREYILERDNFTCQECGKFSMVNELAVHHIKQLAHRGDNSLDNLITLCNTCHRHKHHLP